MATVRLHHAKILGFGVLLDYVAEFFEGDAWFGMGYGKVKTLSRCLDEAYNVWVVSGLLADVECLI